MARQVCTVCAHSGREHIDAALRNDEALRPVAGKYGISRGALERHRANHMGAASIIKPASQAVRVAAHRFVGAALAASDTVEDIRALRSRADVLCKQAEASGDGRTALLAISALTKLLELQGRLTLEAQQGRASDISAHPVWQRLNSELASVLAKYPEAEEEWSAVLRRILYPGGTL